MNYINNTNQTSNYIVDFAEELSKEGYSIVKAGVNTFFKSKGELVSYGIDTYMRIRFEIRLRDFTYEQEKLTKEERESFYKSIDNKKLNYLFELLNKTRISAFDLHAKILSKLYANLVKNQGLKYFEKVLLSNIESFTDEDFMIYKKVIKLFIEDEEKEYYTSENYEEIASLYKFQNLGIIGLDGNLHAFGNNDKYSITLKLNDYSKEFYTILEKVIYSNDDV